MQSCSRSHCRPSRATAVVLAAQELLHRSMLEAVRMVATGCHGRSSQLKPQHALLLDKRTSHAERDTPTCSICLTTESAGPA